MNKFDQLCSDFTRLLVPNTLYKLDVTWEFNDHGWIPLRDNSVIAYLYEIDSETFKIVNAVSFRDFSPADLFADSVEEIKSYVFYIDDPMYLLDHTISITIYGD